MHSLDADAGHVPEISVNLNSICLCTRILRFVTTTIDTTIYATTKTGQASAESHIKRMDC